MGLFSRSEPASHFPDVQGRRLDGTEVAFPGDLPAEATLVVVSFRDDLDPLADQWARLGGRLAEAHGGRVAVVEAPVVNQKLRFLGDLSTVGIRGQVEDEAERERTVPLFVDVKGFRKELGLRDAGDVYAFLLARDGRIAWRGDGDIDLDEVEALEAAVREVLEDADAAEPGPEPGPEPDAGLAEPEDEATDTDRQPDGTESEAGPQSAAFADDPPPVGGSASPEP